MSVSDSFSGGDGGLGGNWTTQQNAPQVVSGAAKGGGAGAYGSAYWSANSFSNDHDAQAKWANGANYAAIACRCSGTGASTNWYGFFTHSDLQKSVNGTVTSLGTRSSAPASGDTLKISVAGNTISTFINGSPTGTPTATDLSLTTGNAGIAYFDNTGTLDDFLATGEIAAAGDTQEWRGCFPVARGMTSPSVTY